MKNIALYLWHAFHAWRLNRIVAKTALQLRWAETKEERSQASTTHREVGAQSNVHERARDDALKQLKASPREAVMVSLLCAAAFVALIYILLR